MSTSRGEKILNGVRQSQERFDTFRRNSVALIDRVAGRLSEMLAKDKPVPIQWRSEDGKNDADNASSAAFLCEVSRVYVCRVEFKLDATDQMSKSIIYPLFLAAQVLLTGICKIWICVGNDWSCDPEVGGYDASAGLDKSPVIQGLRDLIERELEDGFTSWITGHPRRFGFGPTAG